MKISECYCKANKAFSNCCEPYLREIKNPLTAEALMRARYSAYVLKNIAYLKTTLAPECQINFDEKRIYENFQKVTWTNLKIISIKKGQKSDKRGVVEFIAYFTMEGKEHEHHEISQFRQDFKKKCWYYLEKE